MLWSRLNLVEDLIFIEVFIDLGLLMAIILKFFIAFDTDYGIVTNHKEIARHYLGFNFLFDVIWVIPGLVPLNLFPVIYYFKALRFFQLGKFIDRINELFDKFVKVAGKSQNNIVMILLTTTKMSLILFLMLHILAWILILVDCEEINNWKRLENHYFNSVYFITKTITTVGYGDETVSSNTSLFYVMVVELIGICTFSYYRSRISNMTRSKTAKMLINEKHENFRKFFKRISRDNKNNSLPHEIYKEALESIETTYKYQISRVFNEGNFINELKPNLKNQLIWNSLYKHYLNFRHFFYDKARGFTSNDKFITKFMISLECNSFCPGSTIIERGSEVEYLYLIASGKVVVSDHHIGEPIAVWPTFWYFGDYQIFLQTCSNVSFRASYFGTVFCYMLPKDRFLDLWNMYPDHLSFFTARALETRRFYK